MPGGSSKGSSQSQPNISPELQPLYSQTGRNVQSLQNLAPVSDFTTPNPTKVAPLSGTQQGAADLYNMNLRGVTSGQAQAGILNPNARYSQVLAGTDQPLSSDPTLQQTQRYAGLMGSTGGALEDAPIIQAGTQYFNKAIAPGIQNQATLSGLGRSTAETSALGAAQASTMLPLLQGEEQRRQGLITGEQQRTDALTQAAQQRRDALITGAQSRQDTLATQQQARMDQLVNQGMSVGDAQRQVEQEGYNAQATDAQRRQAIAEQALFGPLGQLPSTFGQNVQQAGRQTGMFGSVICTELYRQGYLDEDTYQADSQFGEALYEQCPWLMEAYWKIGRPIAKLMSRSKLATRIMAPIGIAWAKSIKWLTPMLLGEEGSILCLA